MKTSKLIVLISFILMAFTVGDSKSEFLVPYNANSIFINDIDLDGDEDIITGHLYNFSTEWGGFALLENENGGNYILVDSVYIYIYIVVRILSILPTLKMMNILKYLEDIIIIKRQMF